MFVSIVCDLGGEDSRAAVYGLLPQYGFEKVQRACFESSRIGEKQLAALKRDIDKVTDYYDSIRIYQYPVDGRLAISTLKENRWRKIVVKAPAAEAAAQAESLPAQKPASAASLPRSAGPKSAAAPARKPRP